MKCANIKLVSVSMAAGFSGPRPIPANLATGRANNGCGALNKRCVELLLIDVCSRHRRARTRAAKRGIDGRKAEEQGAAIFGGVVEALKAEAKRGRAACTDLGG